MLKYYKAMEIGEIKKILTVFVEYHDDKYRDFFSSPRKARWFYHKEEDYFKIIVFDDTVCSKLERKPISLV